MQYENYPSFHIADDLSVFEFRSVGRNGTIHKRIVFSQTNISGIYNLALGDVDENGEINDSRISDNGDRNKILATVVNAVDEYTKKYPRRRIAFKGNTDERTRLYRMVIGLHLDELSSKFDIFGLVDHQFVPFKPNMSAEAFLVKKKMPNFI